jgi:addiction module HigA family antidote
MANIQVQGVQMTNFETAAPQHPGEILREEYLNPRGLTQQRLADDLHVPFQRINGLVNGKRGITPSTSLRLAKYFGVPDDYWMRLQIQWDLHRHKKKEASLLDQIQPFETTSFYSA